MNKPNHSSSPAKTPLLLLLFFLSGFSALVYEVLWLKELGLLFGNTAYAAATTLAVFFLGLSCGGYFWGKRAPALKNPLRIYAILEIGIAASALLYFLLMDVFYLTYSAMYDSVGHSLFLSTSVKFLLALGLLFLPSFFMGGTFPAMGQYLVRGCSQLGKTGSLLYAINTTGAALGAFIAGFYLPVLLGFRNSYFVAVLMNVVIGAVAYWLSRHAPFETVRTDEADPAVDPAVDMEPSRMWKFVWILAFLSGFITLSLEVLWTRMFAQVLHNSVYSFSAILVTFLISLALGSGLANLLCRLRSSSMTILTTLILLSGILVGITPLVFYELTNGLESIASNQDWARYVQSIFLNAGIVILVPGILIGSVFPYLLKVSQRASTSPGKTIGHLAAINGVGGILGSLVAGFVLLTQFGLWTSIKLMSYCYFLIGIFTTGSFSIKRLAPRFVPALVLILLVYNLFSAGNPTIHLKSEAETLHEIWEGSHGTVAVVSQENDLKIKVDNYYALGGLGAAAAEQRQTQIPLFLHPDAKSVFFLGMGTGISAGAALDFPVRRVVTCELIPEVVVAAEKYFRPYSNGLFDDSRSRIIIEDGRHFLSSTSEKYDVIISDLFIPWHAGTGSLYSKEHFEIARSRLEKDGIFVQWLPLFQISKREFNIIVKTMMQVFPHVTLWRGDFFHHAPTVGIIGQNDLKPLDTAIVTKNVGHIIKSHSSNRITDADVVPYILYSGYLTGSQHLFRESPINTDDRPLVEYLSPKTLQEQEAKRASWLVSFELIDLFEKLFETVPPNEDPILQHLTGDQINYVRAGLSLFKVGAYRDAGRLKEASAIYNDFLRHIPFDIHPDLKELD